MRGDAHLRYDLDSHHSHFPCNPANTNMTLMLLSPLITLSLLVSVSFISASYVPRTPSPRAANKDIWTLAEERGERLYTELQSGCHPDVYKPITREELAAIGFHGVKDTGTQWPPMFETESIFEGSETAKHFKWKAKAGKAYWRPELLRFCMLYFSPVCALSSPSRKSLSCCHTFLFTLIKG